MKKKIYLAPDIEVVDVEMETILAGSYTDQNQGGSNNIPGGYTPPVDPNPDSDKVEDDEEW